MQIEERETKKRTEARESEGGRETVIRHVQKDRQTDRESSKWKLKLKLLQAKR